MKNEIRSRDPVVDIVNYDDKQTKRQKATIENMVGRNHTYEW